MTEARSSYIIVLLVSTNHAANNIISVSDNNQPVFEVRTTRARSGKWEELKMKNILLRSCFN
jgi:hypothetical protein